MPPLLLSDVHSHPLADSFLHNATLPTSITSNSSFLPDCLQRIAECDREKRTGQAATSRLRERETGREWCGTACTGIGTGYGAAAAAVEEPPSSAEDCVARGLMRASKEMGAIEVQQRDDPIFYFATSET